MKKTLALVLIALFTAATVFAVETQSTPLDTGPKSAYMKYEVTELFEPAYMLGANKTINLNTVTHNAGKNSDVMLAGSLIFYIRDKSLFNSSSTKYMDIEISVGDFILQDTNGDIASPSNEQKNEMVTKRLTVDTNADSEYTTVTSATGLKLTIEYKAGNIVNRKSLKPEKKVAELELEWRDKRVQAGDYLATITIKPTTR